LGTLSLNEDDPRYSRRPMGINGVSILVER